MKRLFVALALVLFSLPVMAQQAGRPRKVSTKPATPPACNERDFIQADDTDIASLCQNGQWKDVATGSTGVTIGTTAITGGTNGRVLIDDSGVVGEDAGLTYVKATDALTAAGSISSPIHTAAADLLFKPGANSTSAFNFTKADGTTSVLKIDTTNKQLVVNGSQNISDGGAGILYLGGQNGFVFGDASSASLGSIADIPVNLVQNNTSRWRIPTGGHLIAVADNTYDIGASGATRPRTGYFGTSVSSPAIVDTGGNPSLTIAATGSAVNGLTLTNAATGGTVSLVSSGSDSTIPLALGTKGGVSDNNTALTLGTTKFITFSAANIGSLRLTMDTAGSSIWPTYSGSFRIYADINATEYITISPTAFTVTGVPIVNPGITADTGHTDSNVCQDTTTHQFYSGTGTLGSCLGTSTLSAKNSVTPLADGLASIMQLRPISFRYNSGWGYPEHKTYYGLGAEDVVKILPNLVPLSTKGEPQSVDLLGLVPVLIKALQEQQLQINALKAQIKQ